MENPVGSRLLSELEAVAKDEDVSTYQTALPKESWKSLSLVFDTFCDEAWSRGWVIQVIGVTGKEIRPRIRASRFPLLVRLHHCLRLMLHPENVPGDEQVAFKWLSRTSSIKELGVLQTNVMDLEVRMAVGDTVPSELGAWARLATVLMDGYDERVSGE